MGHAVVVGAEPLVRSQDALCGICGAHSAIRTGFSSSTFYSVTIIRPNSLMLLSSGGWAMGPLETEVPQTVSLRHKGMKRQCIYHVQSTVAYEQVAQYNYGLSILNSSKSSLGNME